MVLEALIRIKDAIKHPWKMFLFGGTISSICLLISYLIFPQSPGIFTVFLITFSMTPFMIKLAYYQEKRDEELIKKRQETNLFYMHRPILLIYTAFFGGMIFFMSLIFTLLPTSFAEKLFKEQVETIRIIRGKFIFGEEFFSIFFNNIGVLLISFLFSFLFGAGAIFILSWNASVLAAAIGMLAKDIGGIIALPLAVLTFLPHGSLEILAYFIGGIAGAIVSASLTKRKSRWFYLVLKDSIFFLSIGFLLLFFAGIIEVFLIKLF